MGRDVRAWPMLVLLLLVVLIALGCVLWFMREALRNEVLAERDELGEAYQANLRLVQAQLLERWNSRLIQMEGCDPSPACFLRCVSNGWTDAAISLDAGGRIVYPRLETEQRSATANAELFALQSLDSKMGRQYAEVVAQLRDRLNDYGTNALASPQRRFLMHELKRLDPGVDLPTLSAEDLAARYLDTKPSFPTNTIPHMSDIRELWCATTHNRSVITLFTTKGLKARLQESVGDVSLPKDQRLLVLAPGEGFQRAGQTWLSIVSVFGPGNPDWRLVLSVDSMVTINKAVWQRVIPYLTVGCTLILIMLGSAIVLARGLGHQVRLARLKNDLVATVSHELKTPLTAMRALVDTLLDSNKLDETTTREYLKLLASENARLSRLIDNFLTFSRLERNKFKFVFAPVSPYQIVNAAIAAMGERVHTPGCTVTSRVAERLPEINADADALTTAVLNLLDNAWKYSGRSEAHRPQCGYQRWSRPFCCRGQRHRPFAT